MLIIMLVRFIFTTLILSIGAAEDLYYRQAENRLWTYLLEIGLLCLVIDIFYTELNIFYLALTPVFIILFVLAFRFGIIKGGADAKALISLCIVFPFGPDLGVFPIFPGVYPFVFSIFFNACLISALSIPFIKYWRKLDMRTLLYIYEFPFLIAIFISFIVSFIVGDLTFLVASALNGGP